MTLEERAREQCALVAERAADSARRWLPHPEAAAKVSIATAIAAAIRNLGADQ